MAFSLALFLFLKPVLPVLEYAVFYDYIKEVLCVNKDKVEMQCNGKCFLKKELAKSSEGSENGKKKDGQRFSFENTVVFFQDIKHTIYFGTDFSNQRLLQNYHYSNLYSHLVISPIFHPPATV
ncbi:hypothetical protein KIV10_09210 [Aequorivita echinoideorum]|uniref:Uncharacterized protein n=1 Tax=Aequorivita echinoideorum TaxID=1549647 RepID=A0ABS5S563_9FLAO|nr:hypothetical protein [Aequorivita echinoideorum]